MQIQVLSIPVDGDGNSMEELNVFLRTHRVLSVDKVAVMDQGRRYWSVYVEYLVCKGAQGVPFRDNFDRLLVHKPVNLVRT
jgi:hypothetical protein